VSRLFDLGGCRAASASQFFLQVVNPLIQQVLALRARLHVRLDPPARAGAQELVTAVQVAVQHLGRRAVRHHNFDSTDLINTDPLLAPLADNGGPTLTMALLPGSPAIDGGSAVAGVTTDQRDIHPSQGIAPDIGAFESRGFALAVVSGDNQSTRPDEPFPVLLAVSVASPFGEPVAGGRVTFAAPPSATHANLASNFWFASANFVNNPATIDSSGLAWVGAAANGLSGT
jgi:hypothetical protein